MRLRKLVVSILTASMVMTSFTMPAMAEGVDTVVEGSEMPAELIGVAEGIENEFVIDTVEGDLTASAMEESELAGGSLEYVTPVPGNTYVSADSTWSYSGGYSGEVYSGELSLYFYSVPFGNSGISKVSIKDSDTGRTLADSAIYRYDETGERKYLRVAINNLPAATYSFVITANDNKEYVIDRVYSTDREVEEADQTPKIGGAYGDSDYLETEQFLYVRLSTEKCVDLNKITPVLINDSNGNPVTEYAGRIGNVYQLKKTAAFDSSKSYEIKIDVVSGYTVKLPEYSSWYYKYGPVVVYNSKSKKTYLYVPDTISAGTVCKVTANISVNGIGKHFEKTVTISAGETLVDWNMDIDFYHNSTWNYDVYIEPETGNDNLWIRCGFEYSRYCYDEPRPENPESWWDDCYDYNTAKGESVRLTYVYHYVDGDSKADKYVNEGLTPVYRYYDEAPNKYEKLPVVKGVRDSEKKTVTFTVDVPYSARCNDEERTVRLYEDITGLEDDNADSVAHQHIYYYNPVSMEGQDVYCTTYEGNEDVVHAGAWVYGCPDKDKFTVKFYDAVTKAEIPGNLLYSYVVEDEDDDEGDEIYSDSLEKYYFGAYYGGIYNSGRNSAYVKIMYDGRVLLDSFCEGKTYYSERGGRTYYSGWGNFSSDEYGSLEMFAKVVDRPYARLEYHAIDGSVKGYSGIYMNRLNSATVSIYDYKSNSLITSFDVTSGEGKFRRYFFTREDLAPVISRDPDLSGFYKVFIEADGVVYDSDYRMNLYVMTDAEREEIEQRYAEDEESSNATPSAGGNNIPATLSAPSVSGVQNISGTISVNSSMSKAARKAFGAGFAGTKDNVKIEGSGKNLKITVSAGSISNNVTLTAGTKVSTGLTGTSVSSENKKIASINKKGVIKLGKMAGTAKVTIDNTVINVTNKTGMLLNDNKAGAEIKKSTASVKAGTDFRFVADLPLNAKIGTIANKKGQLERIGFTFTNDGSGVLIYGKTGAKGSVKIPVEVNGKTYKIAIKVTK